MTRRTDQKSRVATRDVIMRHTVQKSRVATLDASRVATLDVSYNAPYCSKIPGGHPGCIPGSYPGCIQDLPWIIKRHTVQKSRMTLDTSRVVTLDASRIYPGLIPGSYPGCIQGDHPGFLNIYPGCKHYPG
ncbi:hypothetical protein RhiirA1_488432 [Rhizophagus irregularis]|uniref:Uncharacterized protein n=1 Tax=Rhizophagus irregularis TaxID=588596 RepID=A0A2N0RCR9_9GLOM|nr:hypothetical protein RhiirA1_488432 [Rhizophagus irregularis]